MMKKFLLMFCIAIAMLFASVGCDGPGRGMLTPRQIEMKNAFEAERKAAQHAVTENKNPAPLDSSDNTPNDAN